MIRRELAGRNFRFGELAPASVRSAAVPALTTCAQGELRDSGPAPWTQLPNVWAEGSFRDRDAPGVLTGPNSVRHGFRRHVAADLEEAAACGTCVSSRRRAPAAFESRGDAPVSAGLSARGWALGAKLQPQRHVRRTEAGEKCEPASSPAEPGADRVWPRRSGPLSLPDFFLKMKLSS